MRFLTVFSLAIFGMMPLAAQDDGIHWLDNYQEALKEAGRTRKPIFLEFRCEA